MANDLHLDLITATQTYLHFQRLFAVNPPTDMIRTGTNRLCLWYLLLTLSKWIEFYDRYKAIIPSDAQDHAKNLRKTIYNKGIQDFRNKVIGHIWDDTTKSPITIEEGDKQLQRILGSDDIDGFMRWINDPDGNQFPENAVMVVQRVRDRIQEFNGFTANDLI